jgi:8-oxo-dGTP pyrophosphatase MutT (NUDIX family)
MNQAYLASSSGLDQAASISSIVGATIALLAVVVGVLASSGFYQTMALVNRRRKHLGPVVRRVGLCRSHYRFLRTSVQLLQRRVRHGPTPVRDEIAWLSGLEAKRQIEEGAVSSFDVPVPFTFTIATADYASALVGVAAGYRAYASSLRRRWLLRSAAGPLVTEEYECAEATARLLSRWATFEPSSGPADPDHMRGRFVELAKGQRGARLVTWPDMRRARATPGFALVGVSYQPYRVVMDGSPASIVRDEPTEVRHVPNTLDPARSSPLDFDGVLPRWHGPGYRLEIDRLTGRQKLHMCVAETTYFAFRVSQDPTAAAKVGNSRLISLSLLALDWNDVVLLTQRSDHVVYPRCYSGTVTGNCELASREGLDADLDSDGLPDLLSALAREAREELGLDLTSEGSQLAALGIIEYSGETENNTYALIATARLAGDAREFRVGRADPDPLEGVWELGDQFMTVDLGAVLKSPRAGRSFVMWIRSCEELAPQGAGALLLLLTARLELQQRLAERAGHQAPWTTKELRSWLEEPLPARLVSVRRLVGYHPLWR